MQRYNKNPINEVFATCQEICKSVGKREYSLTDMKSEALHTHHAFRIAIEVDFGHTRYFRLRAGERLIDPPTQEHIRQVMTRISISPLPDFDDYVEKYVW